MSSTILSICSWLESLHIQTTKRCMNNYSLPIVAVVFFTIFLDLSAQNTNDENWPGFRGKFASGIAENASPPISWNIETSENIIWKTKVPGLGFSSPVIWEKTSCTGIPKIKRHPKSTHANSTVATDGIYVVAFFGSEGLYCYNIN